MTKGLERSRRRGPPASQNVARVDLPVRGKVISTTDTGAPGAWGTVVLGDVPEGNLVLLGALMNLRLTKNDGNIIDAFNGNVALGTAPTADVTLGGAEVDLLPSTALVTGVAGVSNGNRVPGAATLAGTVFDNTDGSLELNLNLFIPDASSSANSSLTLEGVVHLIFAVLGDD